MTEMTPLAYGKILGITKQGVFKRLKKGGIPLLPGVTEVKVFPRQTILVVDLNQTKNILKKNRKELGLRA